MKVKQILEIMKVISEKRLPTDMEELDQQFYTSESQNKDYTIDEMDIIHLIRSFIKIYTYDKGLEQQPVSLTNQIFKLEKKVSELYAELGSKDKEISFLRQKIMEMYNNTNKSPIYVFSEIPNDNHGDVLVKSMKTYLNKKRYKMRVRGQYLDHDKMREVETWKDFEREVPLDRAKCMRVYIDKKYYSEKDKGSNA